MATQVYPMTLTNIISGILLTVYFWFQCRINSKWSIKRQFKCLQCIKLLFVATNEADKPVHTGSDLEQFQAQVPSIIDISLI